MISKKEFLSLSPRLKGYAVYMAGCREDQPNIPETWTPKPEDQKEYDAGQFDGVLEAQDNP